MHRPYGLGARVPCYIISPWSKGGWVNSQVFDHTSVLRFISARFGISEPNISPWRQAVCGDLTSAFNFAEPNDAEFFSAFPQTAAAAEQARALPGRKLPLVFSIGDFPQQPLGIRPSRALPYSLNCTYRHLRLQHSVEITFNNTGSQAAVFHVYDKKHLLLMPRRYTVAPGQTISDNWYVSDLISGQYDLWILGPNGFHRQLSGNVRHKTPQVELIYQPEYAQLQLQLHNNSKHDIHYAFTDNAYFGGQSWRGVLSAQANTQLLLEISSSGRWYDFSLSCAEFAGFKQRFAGRMENGEDSISDPRMGNC